jgi:hypothetical protein
LTAETNGAATTKQSTETNNDLAAKLDHRYDLTHLIFEFLLSAIILISSFYTLIIYRDPNVSSGVVAISTLVISYWFGKSRPGK